MDSWQRPRACRDAYADRLLATIRSGGRHWRGVSRIPTAPASGAEGARVRRAMPLASPAGRRPLTIARGGRWLLDSEGARRPRPRMTAREAADPAAWREGAGRPGRSAASGARLPSGRGPPPRDTATRGAPRSWAGRGPCRSASTGRRRASALGKWDSAGGGSRGSVKKLRSPGRSRPAPPILPRRSAIEHSERLDGGVHREDRQRGSSPGHRPCTRPSSRAPSTGGLGLRGKVRRLAARGPQG